MENKLLKEHSGVVEKTDRSNINQCKENITQGTPLILFLNRSSLFFHNIHEKTGLYFKSITN